MKRVIMSALVLVAALAVPVFADEILLKDGTVLKGKIIQVNASVIEYDPEGPSVYEQIPRDRATKVIYSDGKELVLAIDILETKNKDTIRCNVVEITKDEIRYRPEGSDEVKTIARTDVLRLRFNDGRTFDPSEKPGEDKSEKIVDRKPEGGFMSSWVRIGTFVGGGGIDGGISNKEQRIAKIYRADLTQAYLIPGTFRSQNTFYTGGAELDVMFPAWRRVQKRGFDFTGVKFGIRGRYGRERVESLLVNSHHDGDGGRTLMGTLMKYDYWAAGPVMNLCFTPRSNTFTFILNLFALGGQVIDGKYAAAAALRDSRLLALRMTGATGFGAPIGTGGDLRQFIFQQKPFNQTSVRGYTIRGGFGPEIALNKKFPIIAGMHLTYAYTRLTFGKALPVYYSGNRTTTNHEIGAEFSVGMHF